MSVSGVDGAYEAEEGVGGGDAYGGTLVCEEGW